ncbi:MAG: TetR family transcriptional regulator [Flavobacterium sp. BFFFF2]|nr:MAG: TetR family transcriptional regulator [Flavobacterium sp. BFFFF2]
MQDKIVEKATELFLKHGFKSITMDDIAEHMGISKKTIYKYFSNKEVLIEASVDLEHGKIKAGMQAVIANGYNPVEENFQLKVMFDDLFKTVVSSPLYQLKRHYPSIYEKMVSNEMISSCQGFFTQNVERGKSEGFYRQNFKTEHYVFFYYNNVFSINESFALEKDAEVFERSLLEYHLRAMVTEKGMGELEKMLGKSI